MKNKQKNKKLVAKTNAAHAMFNVLNKIGLSIKYSNKNSLKYSWDNVYDCWEYSRKYGGSDE